MISAWPDDGGRSRSWAAGYGLALIVAAASLWRIRQHVEPLVSRLYWEYAGRILHRPVTTNYFWSVQHHTAYHPDLASAALLPTRLAPYTGFPAEYPPGALLFFSAIRYVCESLPAFCAAITALMAILFVATLAISLRLLARLYRPDGRRFVPVMLALVFAALAPALVGRFAIARFDILPTFLAVVGLAVFIDRKPVLAALLLGLGASVKIWPGLLVPLIAIECWAPGYSRGKPVMVMLAGAAGFMLPHLMIVGLGTHFSDCLSYLHYLHDRPAQVESLIANLIVLGSYVTGQAISAGFDYGSQNIYGSGAGFLMAAGSLVNVLGLIFTFWVSLRTRRADPDRPGYDLVLPAAGFVVTLTILCSRVFSPEYVMWVVPFVILSCWNAAGVIAAGSFAAALLFIRLTSSRYFDLAMGGATGTSLCLAKNILLVVVAVIFARQMLAVANRPVEAAHRAAPDSLIEDPERITTGVPVS